MSHCSVGERGEERCGKDSVPTNKAKGVHHMGAQEQTIDLGTHTVDIATDHTITIANEAVAVHLDGEEAYRLLVVLRELFSPCSHE